MKINNITILIILALLLSCNKESNQLKNFYLSQYRNPVLVGNYIHLNDSTIWEFNANGEHYSYYLEDDQKSFQSYWYSNDTILFELNYGSGFYKSSEFKYHYWHSDENDTLFLRVLFESGNLDKDTSVLIRM